MTVHIGIMILFYLFWFGPLLLYYILSYIKKKNYYQNIVRFQAQLDQKYLLPELLVRPSFLEGQIIYDTIADTYKQMHEHVNVYKREQIAYREYIEAWVHEIKTPLAATRITLQNQGMDAGVFDELDKIEQYIEQVLYFARSSDVSQDYIIRAFPIQEVVNKVAKRNARSFIYQKIRLEMNELHEIVYSDVKWVEFILNQIVGNALKYSKSNQGVIKIYTIKRDNQIQLHIEDNGIGIPEKDLFRVFNKGFTGENGRKYSQSTGMGLYLCNRLAEKLNLGISINSKKNVGTNVQLIFPQSKVLLIES
ncbi:sensor histidine kinase [Polycladospora coralii]|nr:sensor histidine kinase [Polycladospora coralii]